MSDMERPPRGSSPENGSFDGLQQNLSPRVKKSRSRSFSRSRSRSYSRSRSPSPRFKRKNAYSRSRSRSRSRRRRKSYSRSYSRSRSRSYSPKRRRGGRRSRSVSPLSDRKRHQGDRYNPKESRVLGVFGLSLYTGEKDLRDMFTKYGHIDRVQVVYDHQTGRSRGFAFVYFKDADDAVDAKEHVNGVELDGRRLRVDYSITKRPHTPTPGVYMGRPTRSEREHGDRDHGDRDRGDRDRGDRDRGDRRGGDHYDRDPIYDDHYRTGYSGRGNYY